MATRPDCLHLNPGSAATGWVVLGKSGKFCVIAYICETVTGIVATHGVVVKVRGVGEGRA